MKSEISRVGNWEFMLFFTPLKTEVLFCFFHEKVCFYNWGIGEGRIMPKLIARVGTRACGKREELNSDVLAVLFPSR